jgi:hypothetical protein
MAAFVLKCPACEKKFRYDVSDGWPDFCPLCAHKMGNDRPDDEIVLPAFLSEKTRKTDAVARQVMDGSVQRAEMAAAAAGVPVSEMSGLKITDLNDRKDSEFSFKKEVNDVTRHMDAMKARGMPTGWGAAADTSGIASGAITVNGRVVQGIQPMAGTRANEQLKASLPRMMGRR